jgi:uroporphyrinogen III methyltransferase/synthase
MSGDAPSTPPGVAGPLFGTRVLVTRPRLQAAAVRDRLEGLGAKVLVQPVIRISDPADPAAVDAAVATLDRYDWLVFSSANGVRYLLDRIETIGGGSRSLEGIKLAAIGPGTAEELARYGLRPDVVPAEYRAESLAEALAPEAPGRRFLLARADRGRDVLARALADAGGVVHEIVVYASTDVDRADPEIEPIAKAMAAGRIDWTTVTSSAIARSLVHLFGKDLRRTKLASISPLTSSVLKESGYPPAVEASRYTMDGLIEAILRAGN